MDKGLTPAKAQALRHATAEEILEVTTVVNDVHQSVQAANDELDCLYDTLKKTEPVVERYNRLSKICREKMQNLGMMLH